MWRGIVFSASRPTLRPFPLFEYVMILFEIRSNRTKSVIRGRDQEGHEDTDSRRQQGRESKPGCG